MWSPKFEETHRETFEQPYKLYTFPYILHNQISSYISYEIYAVPICMYTATDIVNHLHTHMDYV